ncbi:YitT family protein [Aquibacillus rhizosphaerae]|uniref:YitT family protein n=1 Tax=Aquibacillus rhizosphaerae TaxID=3051431 RepID=A0ABT7L328_9BACI|nr:YitT family protein [Aquibacillus sp. LR5S19]MDL4839585.1 YitT family protein [Aquibacillus sp. LR5S19]
MKYLTHHYFLITCGSFIQGMAMSLFLFPHSIPSGGAAGIAVLLNYWFGIPLSFALWFVNFSLLVLAIYWLGNSSAIGTMYAITITSISVHLFSMDLFVHYSNIWLDLFIGSVTLGIGVGILLRQKVSNGGMGVLALIIAVHRNSSPGKPLLLLNGLIFILTGSIIHWPIVFQAILLQFGSTKIVDIVYNLKLIPKIPKITPPVVWRKK